MLNAWVLPDDVSLCGLESRARVLEKLISEFRSAFSGIQYEFDTQTRVVNAQAFSCGDFRFVRLYGGLALHPLFREDAIVFTLLHETGHLLARGRRFAGDPSLACDCLADRWALGSGAKALRRSSGRVLNVSVALDSLDAIIVSTQAGVKTSYASRQKNSQACWADFWPLRKSRLRSSLPSLPTAPCYFLC
jgi:hypothetical protein